MNKFAINGGDIAYAHKKFKNNTEVITKKYIMEW